jgi:hypothetical protein
MELKALIVEQLEEEGTLRSLKMKKSPSPFDLVVAFPDEYDEPRDGPFHFHDQKTARRFAEDFAQCRLRRIGPRHFFRSGDAYHVDLNWEGIPTAGDGGLTYYALSLPENAIPINLSVTDPHSPGREYYRTVTRDDQRRRYVIYLDCSSPKDYFDFYLSCDFEIDPARFPTSEYSDANSEQFGRAIDEYRDFLPRQETEKVNQFFSNRIDMDRPIMARENTLRNALIGGVATVLAALIGYYAVIHKSSSQDIQYAGRVVDEQTNGAIQGALVSVETQGPPQSYYTDTNGIFHTTLSPDIKVVRIKVEATGYKPVDRNVSPVSRAGLEDIRLERLQGGVSITLPDEIELKKAIEFVAEHSKSGVQYIGNCNPQFMQTKVRGGVFQDNDWGEIIEQLQFRLKNSKTKSHYQVTRIKERGIYQIECAN